MKRTLLLILVLLLVSGVGIGWSTIVHRSIIFEDADTVGTVTVIPPNANHANVTVTLPNATGTLLTTASGAIDGELITNDTIDDDSIDFADVTCADLTMTDCGQTTVTGTVITSVGLDAVGAVDLDYGSVDVTDHTFVTDSTGDGEIVLPNDSIGINEINLGASFTHTGTLTVAGTADSGTGVLITGHMTSDPCNAGREGAIFWNDSAKELCYCDGTNDLRVKDATTACF